MTLENLIARLKQENLAGKNDIANFVNKTGFNDKLKNLNKKITSNRTENVIVENELKKITDNWLNPFYWLKLL